MIFFQRTNFLLGLIILLLCNSSSINALNEEFDIFNENTFDVFTHDAFNDLMENTQFTINRQVDIPGTVEILDDLGVTDILQEDFFKRTSLLKKRSLLDSPFYIADKKYSYNNWVISCHLFYEQMSASNFSKDCTGIKAYLSLRDETLIQKLNSSIEKVQALFPSFGIDPIKGLSLFENGTIQQRRIGSMMHFTHIFRWCKLWFKIPLYYLERNYSLTYEEQRAVEEEFGAIDPEEQERFIREHLVSDKLGFGDSRLAIERRIYQKNNMSLNGGIYTTLPSGFALKKGLYGSYFPPLQNRPTFDFSQIIELGTEPDTQQQAEKRATDFFLCVLDNLSAMVLECPIGNNGHLGFGAFIRSTTPMSMFIKRPWAANIMFKSFLSFEYLIASRKKQFFIEKDDPREFASRTFQDNDDEALDNLTFLNKKFIDKFIPFTLEVTNKPGVIVIWTSKIAYEKKYWGIHLGSDLWMQSTGSITNISAKTRQHNRLQVNKAKSFWAYQNKLLGTLYWKLKRRNKDWLISLNIAETTQSSGIGEDWTLSLNIETNF